MNYILLSVFVGGLLSAVSITNIDGRICQRTVVTNIHTCENVKSLTLDSIHRWLFNSARFLCQQHYTDHKSETVSALLSCDLTEMAIWSMSANSTGSLYTSNLDRAGGAGMGASLG